MINETIKKKSKINKDMLMGIVVSIITIVILQPLWNVLSSYFIKKGTIISKLVFDSYFNEASLGVSNNLIIMNNSNIAFIVNMIIISGVFWLSSTMNGLGKAIERAENIQSVINNKDSLEVITLESVMPSAKKSYRTSKFLLFVISLFAAYLILSNFYDSYKYVTANNLNINFQRNLKILSGNVDQISIRELESKWANMKSYDDYKAIAKEMQTISKQQNMTLRKMDYID